MPVRLKRRDLILGDKSPCRITKPTANNVYERSPGSERGQLKEALQTLGLMDPGDSRLQLSYSRLLQWCINRNALAQGKNVHTRMIESGLKPNILTEITLLEMYTHCTGIFDARQMFNHMQERNLCTWNMIISAYSKDGYSEEVLRLFWQMEEEGVKADEVTFLSLLKACANLGNPEPAKQIHARILKSKIGRNTLMNNTLIDMYAKCGEIEDACQIFSNLQVRSVVSWNVIIAGYINHGYIDEAFRLFQQMEQEGMLPTKRTFASILSLWTRCLDLEKGKWIHDCMIKLGIQQNHFLQSGLVNVYVRCGSIEDARAIFDRALGLDVVMWTAMVAGYAKCGHAAEVLNLFQRMEEEAVKPNQVTFVSIVKACANLAALEQGEQIHTCIIEAAFESEAFVGCALVDMYAKCGSIEDARQIFENMPSRDTLSWSAMLAGYAQHGLSKDALLLFERMHCEGVKLNHVSFTNVLSACSHAGLVDDGHHFFCSMSQNHGIMPSAEHYACMVDLLGRAGCLKEAETFIQSMPFQPPAVVWIALLGACRIYDDVERAKFAAESILQVEPRNTASLVLLSNMYVAARACSGVNE